MVTGVSPAGGVLSGAGEAKIRGCEAPMGVEICSVLAGSSRGSPDPSRAGVMSGVWATATALGMGTGVGATGPAGADWPRNAANSRPIRSRTSRAD